MSVAAMNRPIYSLETCVPKKYLYSFPIYRCEVDMSILKTPTKGNLEQVLDGPSYNDFLYYQVKHGTDGQK